MLAPEGRTMIRADISTELQTLVRERIDDWQAGQRPDAARALAEHPQLVGAKSLVLDLVLAEYRLRSSAGEDVSKGELCDRFPDFRQSISQLLSVEDYLDRCPAFAAADEPLRWPVPGDEFLGYTIVEPLGCGGIARVYLAREREVGGRLIVIKVSPWGGREAERQGKVSHPNIMPIHSVKHDPASGWTALCMPLVGIATAVDVLDRAFARGAVPHSGAIISAVAFQARPVSPIPEPTAPTAGQWRRLTYSDAVAHIAWQLAQGLAAAHAAGIMHRDIKPSNILFDWSGRPLLLDFNLSTDSEPAAQRIGGTPAYMAPERIAALLGEDAGAVNRFHPQCDLYSLGAVLYQLLCGRLPTSHSGAAEAHAGDLAAWLADKRRPVPPIGTTGPDVDPHLEAIVRRCLEVEPARRFATAADLASALGNYLSRGPSALRSIKRRRRAIVLCTAGVLAAGTALGAYVGTRPTALELQYQAGLDAYEQGDFRSAIGSFTRCLEIEPGWPPSLFGRAQSQRMLARWDEAHSDFLALRSANAGWAYALAGYCSLRIPHLGQAATDYSSAIKAGLRDSGVLLNYARVVIMLQDPGQAISLYSRVLSFDPQNKQAFANRALTHASIALGKRVVPCQQAFEDAQTYCRLDPESFLGPYIAAIIYGTAALQAPEFEDQAIGHLTEAIRRRMPLKFIQNYRKPLKRLQLYLNAESLATANCDPGYILDLRPIVHPPQTADWRRFQTQTNLSARIAADTR